MGGMLGSGSNVDDDDEEEVAGGDPEGSAPVAAACDEEGVTVMDDAGATLKETEGSCLLPSMGNRRSASCESLSSAGRGAAEVFELESSGLAANVLAWAFCGEAGGARQKVKSRSGGVGKRCRQGPKARRRGAEHSPPLALLCRG